MEKSKLHSSNGIVLICSKHANARLLYSWFLFCFIDQTIYFLLIHRAYQSLHIQLIAGMPLPSLLPAYVQRMACLPCLTIQSVVNELTSIKPHSLVLVARTDQILIALLGSSIVDIWLQTPRLSCLLLCYQKMSVHSTDIFRHVNPETCSHSREVGISQGPQFAGNCAYVRSVTF